MVYAANKAPSMTNGDTSYFRTSVDTQQ